MSSSSSPCSWFCSSSSPTSKFPRRKAGPSMRLLPASGRGERAKVTRHPRSCSTPWELIHKCEVPHTTSPVCSQQPKDLSEHRQLDETFKLTRSQQSWAWGSFLQPVVMSRRIFRTFNGSRILTKDCCSDLFRQATGFIIFLLLILLLFFYQPESPLSTSLASP